MKLKSLTNKDRYGNMFSVEFFEPQTSVPMMMLIPEMEEKGYNGATVEGHPGDPKGTDTVPAWLTPGENVVNAEASRIPGNQEKIDQMNEEGQAIQQAQGGPIPTYEADGGFIQGLVDTFTLPTPPAGSGIKYRRHKDGSIGMWAGNTYRGKYEEPKKKESSFSDMIGISYNADGGMIPPMYASAGQEVPSWLTDDVLDSLMMTESSGNPNATSEAGAQGLYQIMPSTAAQPGMGVTPLAPEDIRDPAKSRAFARDYLTGLANANPDFTRDEVLTAYHSGAGNVRKAKEGVEPLGPRGEVYADKVMSGVEEPSVLDRVASLAGDALSAINPISTAQAQTNVPPIDSEVPPEPNVVDSNAEFNRKVAEGNAEAVGNSFKEMETKRLANIEAGRPEFQGINEKTYIGLKDAVEFQKQNVIEETEQSLITNKVDPGLAQAALDAKKVEAEGLGVPTPEEIAVSKTPEYQAHVERAAAAGVKPKSPAEFAEHFTVDESGSSPASREFPFSDTDDTESAVGEAVTEAQKKKDDAAKKIVEENSDKMTPEGEQSIQDLLNSLKDKPPEEQSKFQAFADSALAAFKDAFADLFSPKELARMAIVYTGSRLMGYSHEGSFAYGAKSYLSRVDADIAAREKFVNSSEAMENYTADSLSEYRKTGDRSKLVGKALGMKKTAGNIYMPGVGKMQVFADKNGKEYIEFEGKTIPIDQVAGLVEPWDETVHGDKALTSAFKASVADDVAVINSEFGFKDEDKLVVRESDIASKASGIMRNIMRRNGVSINESEPFKAAIRGGINDFIRAKAEAKKNGTTMPMSLEAFIERRSYQPLTGVSQSQVNNTSVDNLRTLNQMIKREMTNKKASDPAYNTEYKADWNATYAAYASLPSETRQKFEADAARKGGWNGFTLWMSKTPVDEVVKILQQQ